MRVFKIILAVMVIFAAGVVTGTLAAKKAPAPPAAAPKPAASTPPNVGWTRERKAEYLEKLDKYLALSDSQKDQIEAILDAGNQRMAEHWATIEPKIKEEYRSCRKQISEVLTPEQRKKQEEWRAQKNKQKGDNKSADQKAATTSSQKLVPEAK